MLDYSIGDPGKVKLGQGRQYRSQKLGHETSRPSAHSNIYYIGYIRNKGFGYSLQGMFNKINLR